MADSQRTIEILLQLKQSGQEVVDNLAKTLKDLANPVADVKNAFDGFAAAGTKAASGITASLQTFQKELKSGELAVKAFGGTASAAFNGVALAAEGIWTALTFGVSGVIKIFTTALSFLDPFKIQGLVTGAAFGGAGLVAKEWVDAADAVDTYRQRLGVVIGDQAIANRIFDDFETLSEKSGIDAEKLAEVFTRLFDLRVKDAQGATTTLASVSAFMHEDIDSLLEVISNPNPRGLKQLGIDMNDVGKQVELVSGNIRVQMDNTEESIRQGLIDLLSQKFPNALNDAQKSVATQMAILQIQLGQYAQQFGAILLPAARDSLQAINSFLQENRENIVAFIRTIPDIASAAYEAVTSLLNSGQIQTLLLPLNLALTNAFGDLVSDLVGVLLAALKLLAVPVVAVWRVMLAELQSAWQIFANDLIPTLINAVTAKIASAAAAIEKLRDELLVPLDWFGSVTGAGKFPRELAGELPLAIAQGLPKLPVQPIDDVAKDFVPKIDAALDEAVKSTKAASSQMGGAFKNLFTDLTADSKTTFGAFTDLFGPQIAKAVASFQATLQKMRAEASANRSPNQPTIQKQPVDSETRFAISQLSRSALDQQIEDVKHAGDRQLTAYKATLKGKQDEDVLAAAAEVGVRKQVTDKVADLENQKVAASDQANVAITHGYEQMVAQNKLAYDQDLANWQKRLAAGAISPQQFAAGVAQAGQNFVDANARALDQMAIKQDEFNAAVTKGRDQLVANAQLAYDRDLANWRTAWQNKEITDEQFSDIQTRLAEERTDKLTEANGSFMDGIALGFKQMNESLQTAAQVGIDVAGKMADGFADAFGSIVSGTSSVSDAFTKMAASILSDIARILARQAFVSLFTSAFGSLFPSGTASDSVDMGALLAQNKGGLVPGFAGGGFVGGAGPDVDSVPAMLSPREFVVQAPVVAQPGMLSFLQRINAGMASVAFHATGGLVSAPPMAAGRAIGMPQVVPAIVASESAMRTLLSGGGNAVLDFMRSNSSKVNAALGRS